MLNRVDMNVVHQTFYVRFVATQVLAEHPIVWLPSPPRTPWYDGGCEAGNHSMRTRTDHFAERAGGWTSECLEAARSQANELTRPARVPLLACPAVPFRVE